MVASMSITRSDLVALVLAIAAGVAGVVVWANGTVSLGLTLGSDGQFVRVLDVTPFSIDLSSDATAQPPKYPTIVMDTCIDVSEVNVVDAEGKSVVASTRPPQSAARVDVVQFDFGWRVNKIQSAGQPCEA